jgi:aspartyl-tRNA(Asn)/glutamyl-tRNA(Gln) amidotransferase subunit A
MAPPVPSVAEAGRRLREGSLTAEALLGMHIARVAATNDAVRAVWAMDGRAAEIARRADRELAEGVDRGPLHGIPFLVKDMVDVEGMPTTNGSRLPARPAERDAARGRAAH